MIPFLGFLDYKENIRLNNTLFCQLAHRASCGQVQLARPTVYLPRAIGQPRISTPVLGVKTNNYQFAKFAPLCFARGLSKPFSFYFVTRRAVYEMFCTSVTLSCYIARLFY